MVRDFILLSYYSKLQFVRECQNHTRRFSTYRPKLYG